MFCDLSPEEIKAFEEYDRNNLPGRADWSMFHPVCREIWFILACEHDGFNPQSDFIVFSETNPYFLEAE